MMWLFASTEPTLLENSLLHIKGWKLSFLHYIHLFRAWGSRVTGSDVFVNAVKMVVSRKEIFHPRAYYGKILDLMLMKVSAQTNMTNWTNRMSMKMLASVFYCEYDTMFLFLLNCQKHLYILTIMDQILVAAAS